MKKSGKYISNIFRKMIALFQKNLFLRNAKGIIYYVDSILLLFIKKESYKKQKKKQILLIYNLAFGDGVIWRCSAMNLRKVYPKDKYEITLICQKGINKLYEKDDTYDKIIPIDFNKATINIKERISNFKILRSNYYDIVLDPVGISEWTTNVLYTHAALANEKIGLIDNTIEFHCSRKKINKIYNKIIEINKPNISLIDYYNTFISNLSTNKLNIKPRLEKLKTTKTKLEMPKDYFIVFPCASIDLKKWPIERYAKLAEKIYNKTKYKLVLVGTEVDKPSIEEFKEKISIPYLDLVCKTTLNDYIDIISNAKMIITNDTSAYHIAVVEETPVALIVGMYTYDRYALYQFEGCEKYKRPYIVASVDRKCKNCNNRCKYLKKTDKIWPCLEEIDVDYAWQIVEKLIIDNYGGKDGHRKTKTNNK